MKHWMGLGAALLLAASSANAFTMDIVASVDGDVQRTAIGFNVDTTDDIVTTLRSGGNNVINGVYEFDLAGLPAGATITSATLKLTLRQGISNIGSTADVFFSAFPGDGVIDASDHLLNTTGIAVADETYGVGAAGPAAGTILSIPFDVITPIQDALDAVGSDYVTVRSETVDFVNFAIHSLETTNSTAALPTLSVEYVPEPTSLMLLSLAGLLIRRR